MKVWFEVWDSDTGNLLSVFPREEEARALLNLYNDPHLMLLRVEDVDGEQNITRLPENG